MRAKTVKGIIITPLTMEMGEVTIRAESTVKIKGVKTGKVKGVKDNFTTVSLADEKRGIMIQVNLADIKKLIKEL